MNKRALCKIIMAYLLIATGFSFALPPNTCREETWVPNGPVKAIAVADGRVYIGGTFSKVGPYTGCGVPVHQITGAAYGSYPKINGIVYVVCSDGNHGWFVGGIFSAVGGIPRNNIAHIFADGQVDMDWDPGTDDYVQVLTLNGRTLYIGGNFTTVGGMVRNHAAALDAVTGSVKSWDPDVGGWVTAIAVDGPTVYIGGNICTIRNENRVKIGAVDTSAGIPTPWDPGGFGHVTSIIVSASVLYVAGCFSEIGGASRENIAALDIATGLATDFNANIQMHAAVASLVLNSSTLYITGTFDTIGGQHQPYIAAINSTTGELLDWNPEPDGYVNSITLHNSSIYASGSFSRIGGQDRNCAAELDCATAAATPWNPNPNLRAYTTAVDDSTVFIGGEFTSLGGLIRNRIASLDIATGAATSWNPDVDGEILTIATQANRVYIGGTFTQINGQGRNNIACIDAETGKVTDWLGNSNGTVLSLAVNGSRIYAGGEFDSINSSRRRKIAAMDAATGSVLSWNPIDSCGYTNSVRAIVATDTVVYVGGSFDTIGGMHRYSIAAIYASTGTATPFNPPETIMNVNVLLLKGTNLYIGGRFPYSMKDGHSRHIAAVDITTGIVKKWGADMMNEVLSLAAIGTTVFAGQDYGNLAEEGYLTAINASTGLEDSWKTYASYWVSALASSEHRLYVGGSFYSIGGEERPFFAQFGNGDPVPVEVPVTTPMMEKIYASVIGTTVRYTLPDDGRLTIEILTIQGKRVFHRSISSGAGNHETVLPLKNLTNGIYIVKAASESFRLAKKINVLH